MGKHVVDMVEEAALNAAFDAGVHAALEIISTFANSDFELVEEIIEEVETLLEDGESN